jgi:tripartite-type tricarboxylate transporter receptor subunit TctC
MRSRFVEFAAAALALVWVASGGFAQEIPSKPPFPLPGKPVRIVVPFTPGGQTDIEARAIALKMAESMGASVIVENKPGASTAIGARDVMTAAPDGHALLYTLAVHVQLPHLYKSPPWDPFRDFTPIATGTRAATVLTAHASVPFNTVPELVAYAKANPGKLNYASFGPGTTSHLNAEHLKRLAGIEIEHVPYKGSGEAMKDLLTGRVQLFFDGAPTGVANARTGKVKLVAWAAETRNKALPDLPTLRESGYDVGMWGYLWFWGPGGMQPATVDAVYRHISRALAAPEVRELVEKNGAEVSGMSPAETARAARDLYDRWGAIIRDLGVRLD